MAEVLTATRSQVDITAGRKVHPTTENRVRVVIIDTPAVWSAANGDTAATGIVLRKGSRLLGPVLLSSALGTASTTLSIGLRDPLTKVAIDATAIVSAGSIATAQSQSLVTGTKLTAGQYYPLPSGAEIYLTFGGDTPLANQAIRAEIRYVAP